MKSPANRRGSFASGHADRLEQRARSLGDARHDVIGPLDNIAVRELQYEITVHGQPIHSLGIEPHLCAGPVPSVSQHFDDQWSIGKAEVDADQSVTTSTENLLWESEAPPRPRPAVARALARASCVRRE